MGDHFDSILGICSSILERIDSLWAVLGPSPPPYLDDLLKLELTVSELEAAVNLGCSSMMEVDEVASNSNTVTTTLSGQSSTLTVLNFGSSSAIETEDDGATKQSPLILELIRGRELVSQLEAQLYQQSGVDPCKSLTSNLRSTLEKAICLAKLSDFHNKRQRTSTDYSGRPHSESPDQAFKDREGRETSKKRKTLPNWTNQVQVGTGEGFGEPPDDGYNWKKYGQKDILGAKNPSGYYRCTHRITLGCLATKQIQRSDENPSIFQVTYRGAHTCHQTPQPQNPIETQQPVLNVKAFGISLMKLEEAVYVADDLLREFGCKLQEPSTPYPKLASIKHKLLFKEGASTEVDEGEKVVDVDPVIKACNLYPKRAAEEIARSLRGLVGASKEKPKKILSERQEAVFSDWIRVIRERIDDLARNEALGSFYLPFLGLDSPPVVYDRDDDRKKVIELLLSDSCGERSSVSVVWIVAAAGMGKTTLCHLVYNDSEVCNLFEIKIWVSCVSDAEGKGLLRSIVESVTGISCYLTEIDQLQEALEEELIDKRFLLVLDDVRHMDQSFWNDLLLPPLRAGAKGSIVVVTTRKTTVPNIMESIQPYYLNSLSDESCWMIFMCLVVCDKRRSYMQNNKHIILSKCKGVPLIAKALGGLARFRDLEIFLSKINLVDDAELENYTLSVLRLCYDGLPMYLKRCFVYCSLFPKGYIFDKDLLVRLWMSEGFILPEDGKSVEAIGTHYFNQLFLRSFFQYSPIYDAEEGKFVMHDLFHDLAGSASLPWVECLRTESCGLCKIPEEINHTSFVPCELETVIPFDPFEESKDLLTFLLINRSILKWDASLFRFENTVILHNLFMKFGRLRTIDLSNTNIEELPSSVENLQHLCYLGLNNTNIKRLPESICSLHSLQTLELQHCNCLIELPKDTKSLANLRRLNVWKEAGFVSMPPGIGQLVSLQTLSTFHVGEDMLQCGIRELKDLVSLRGDLCIGGLENVISGKDAEDADLKNKVYLRTLTLQWLDIGWDLDGNNRGAAAVDVLQGLQPHSSLQELIIRDYYGKHFPRWMGETSFSQLLSITLDNCYRCNVLPPLGQLPSLKCLSIRKMDGVQFVGREFCGSGAAGKTGFPSLEKLKLWEMYEWEQWDEVDDGDFPRLRSLTISRCPKIRRLPCFTSLLELSVHCCTNLPGIPTLQSLESLKIEGFQNLSSVALPSDLPALKMLEINYCNQLSSVVGIGHLSSVEQLKIIKCPKLQLLTNEQIPLMLQVVHIHCSCPLLREWCPYGFEEEAGTRVIRKLVRNTQMRQ